jgi:toxin ParE1/3/4
MSGRAYFSSSARRDLLEMLEFIARDKPRAALSHVERLEKECSRLASNSELGTARDDLLPRMRAWSVGKHVIFYRPTTNGIEVVRIVHGSRDLEGLFS